MYFTILGSMETTPLRTPIGITAPKQRAVLAVLLLDANNDVSVDRLTRYVWDGVPPRAAQTTLQSYIYRLRRLLRPLADVELQTNSTGYTLRVHPGKTDLWSFRQMMTDAHDKVSRGDLPGSVRDLRSALSLWRGNALAGVPGKLIRQEARFLEDERIAAYEELFHAELALGGHRAIVPELHKVVAGYHLHEMLRAQLMLALYRSGRQAEALQVYSAFRRALREELGIDPGSELQSLHRAILEHTPPMAIRLPLTGGRSARAS
jgi:DNA-binding SARP family transcriptional activator